MVAGPNGLDLKNLCKPAKIEICFKNGLKIKKKFLLDVVAHSCMPLLGDRALPPRGHVLIRARLII